MITFYDIPSSSPGKAWSPNTFRTRVALLFKGVPFKTEWIEYPDIGPRMKELGADATDKWEDGSPRWTLPVIKDDATGKVISDSWDIAVYLDETYPDKPKLFPFEARAPIRLFQAHYFDTVITPARRVVISEAFLKLNPASQPFFRRTREAMFKVKMEELAPAGPKRQEMWAGAKAGFDSLAAKYASNGDGSLPYFYGNTISYADLLVVAHLLTIRTVLGPDHPEWKEVLEWSNGRWKNFFELTKKYQVIDD